MIEFRPFPKIARLNRDIIITEKIDGTNAAIGVDEHISGRVWAQSRKRIITPEDDNFGFARWVRDNALTLEALLGPGLHFGEWWGAGIQRGYGLKGKRFSLFNTSRWAEWLRRDYVALSGGELGVVPVLYQGLFSEVYIEECLATLREKGSQAAPGFMRPEGIVIYHTASRDMFKVTLEKDEAPKSVVAA